VLAASRDRRRRTLQTTRVAIPASGELCRTGSSATPDLSAVAAGDSSSSSVQSVHIIRHRAASCMGRGRDYRLPCLGECATCPVPPLLKPQA